MMTYVNKRGDTVRVTVSNHARDRFRQRWQSAFPGRSLPADTDAAIADWFCGARRLELKGKYRERSERHGGDSLYFYFPPFVFVVQSGVLLTVELRGSGLRELNRDGQRGGARADDAAPTRRLSVIGWTADDDGVRNRSVKLGSIDALALAGRPQRLRSDEGFLQLARERFQAKHPDRELIAIWVRPTGKGRSVWIWGDQAPFARGREMREAS